MAAPNAFDARINSLHPVRKNTGSSLTVRLCQGRAALRWFWERGPRALTGPAAARAR